MSVLPAGGIGEVTLAEDDAVERLVELDVDHHSAFRALHLHLAHLGHVHHDGRPVHCLSH